MPQSIWPNSRKLPDEIMAGVSAEEAETLV